MQIKRTKVKLFWTIWAVGFNSIRGYNKKIIELKIFIGPAVITFW